MNKMQRQNINLGLHSLQPYRVINLQYQIWNALFGSIPKIISILEDNDFNFICLAQYLGCSFEALYKLRLVAQQWGVTPFTHLLYTYLQIANTPETFVQTIFEWARIIGKLNTWINFVISEKELPKIYIHFVDIYAK